VASKLAYRIRCEENTVFYVYWTGDMWTAENERACTYESREAAERVAAGLDLPRGFTPGRKPVVSTFER